MVDPLVCAAGRATAALWGPPEWSGRAFCVPDVFWITLDCLSAMSIRRGPVPAVVTGSGRLGPPWPGPEPVGKGTDVCFAGAIEEPDADRPARPATAGPAGASDNGWLARAVLLTIRNAGTTGLGTVGVFRRGATGVDKAALDRVWQGGTAETGSCGRVASGLVREGRMATAMLRSDCERGVKNKPVSADRTRRNEEVVGVFGVETISLARADGCSRGRALQG